MSLGATLFMPHTYMGRAALERQIHLFLPLGGACTFIIGQGVKAARAGNTGLIFWRSPVFC